MMHPYKLRHAALTIAIDNITFSFLMIPPFRSLRLMKPNNDFHHIGVFD